MSISPYLTIALSILPSCAPVSSIILLLFDTFMVSLLLAINVVSSLIIRFGLVSISNFEDPCTATAVSSAY